MFECCKLECLIVCRSLGQETLCNLDLIYHSTYRTATHTQKSLLVVVLYQLTSQHNLVCEPSITALIMLYCCLGYNEEELCFGVMKKGVFKPASDFQFHFFAEVICSDPHSSGYMIQLTPDRSDQTDDPQSTRHINYIAVVVMW